MSFGYVVEIVLKDHLAFESGANTAPALAADGRVVTSSVWKESKDRLASAKKRKAVTVDSVRQGLSVTTYDLDFIIT